MFVAACVSGFWLVRITRAVSAPNSATQAKIALAVRDAYRLALLGCIEFGDVDSGADAAWSSGSVSTGSVSTG